MNKKREDGLKLKSKFLMNVSNNNKKMTPKSAKASQYLYYFFKYKEGNARPYTLLGIFAFSIYLKSAKSVTLEQ